MTDEMNLWRSFRALGDPTRLRILHYLSCCPEAINSESDQGRGASAGAVCCAMTGLTSINSTISHHLHELRDAGMVEIVRSGKSMICTLNRDRITELSAHLNAVLNGECDCQNGEKNEN